MRPTQNQTAASMGTAVGDPPDAAILRHRRRRPFGSAASKAPLLATVAVAAFATLAGATGASATPGSQSASPASATVRLGTVHVARASGVGKVLVTARGRTLYLFGPDRQEKVTCTGACAHAWPPLDVTGKPVAGPGIKASLLGTVKAPNGKRQVTYNHWPLYTFVGDSKAGQANGQDLVAFGGTWFALNPGGKRAKSTPPTGSPTTTTTLSYP